ncbi:cyclin A [Fistulifera solaris]|uniref:Cyclin A n=1 Tax=Fistulifera solaris TaxID=1519565 RepID=A0A1Z5JAV4_FISSO|nr:cyclin A [Fistulifera solaris]|eukprot:GAX11089.1 cyclin A [Fistulifera solaris]
MKSARSPDLPRKRPRRDGAKRARAALGDVSNATDNARNRSSGMPVKVRRSSRLSGVDKLKEETDGISHFHENLSIELAKDLSEEPKSKRRRVETRRSSGSSCFGDETDHHTTTFDMNVSSPFDCSKYTLGFSRHDKSTRGDVLQAPEYVCDIFQRLFKIESKVLETASRLHPSMENQAELNPTMRMIVIDWLVEVHAKFRLDPATLHLCVHIFDRFLSVQQVSRGRVQLVAVTSLLLASKYEDIYPPQIKDCVYVTDRAYSRDDILEMESEILAKLDFKISEPTGYPFLRRFLFISKATPLMETAAHYYMDRMLQEPDYLKHRPSLFAASAVCLAINNEDIRSSDGVESKPGIPVILLEYTGFTAEEILDVSSLIVNKLSKSVVLASKRQLYAVKEKYSHPDYMSIAVDIDPPEIASLSNRQGKKRS